MKFSHVDVFTDKAYGGNSLTVFHDADLSREARQSITLEMRHFESIFLQPTSDAQIWRAQVVALDGELPFAGHPLLGAAAVLHQRAQSNQAMQNEWIFALAQRNVRVTTQSTKEGVLATLELESPTVHEPVGSQHTASLLEAFGLKPLHGHPSYPPQRVDVGLRYLVLPLAHGLAAARVNAKDLGQRLHAVGAELAYLLEIRDVEDGIRLEARHWTNDGAVEDVATGSGAAAATAFLATHGRIESHVWNVIRQGRFAGRPSAIGICANVRSGRIENIKISGSVVYVGEGALVALPQDTPSEEPCYG